MNKFEEFELPKRQSREEQAASVRAEFPECSASVDYLRALFGDDIQVLAMSEAGKSITPKNYKADNDYRLWISGARFLELSKKYGKQEKFVNEGSSDAKRK